MCLEKLPTDYKKTVCKTCVDNLLREERASFVDEMRNFIRDYVRTSVTTSMSAFIPQEPPHKRQRIIESMSDSAFDSEGTKESVDMDPGPSNSASKMESRYLLATEDLEPLLRAMRDALKIEEVEETKTIQDELFGLHKVNNTLKELILEEWREPENRISISKEFKNRLSFDEAETKVWNSTPKVDIQVIKMTKKTDLPFEDAIQLKECAMLNLKSNIATTSMARTLFHWVTELESHIRDGTPREMLLSTFPTLRAATAFIADASAEGKSGFSNPQEFFIDFLERRGCFVANKTSMRQPSVEEDESRDDADDAAQSCSPTPLRRKLAQAGVNKMHDIRAPMLLSFRDYLKLHFSETSIRHMVENVSRFLHFVSPDKISLAFLTDQEKTKEFVRTHLQSNTTTRTIKNYLGNIQWFVRFVMSENVCEDTKKAAETFLEGLSKINEELNQKSSKRPKISHRKLTPKDCHKVLVTAKPHIADIILRSNCTVDDKEKTLVCYYLQALLILRHLRKTSVVQNLTVTDWLERQETNFCDGRTTSKVYIVQTQGTAIVLTHEEELLFSKYFRNIRPTQLKKDAKTVNQFFLSCKGKPVSNSSNDLRRLHEKLHLPAVTGKEVKEAFDQWADENLSREDQENVYNYIDLDISQPFSNNSVIKGMLILSTLRGTKEQSSGPPTKRRRIDEESEQERVTEMEEDGSGEEGLVYLKEQSFQKLLGVYPMGLHRTPPSLNICRTVSLPNARYCQDKWRRNQYKDRILKVLDHFRNLPSEKQVKVYMERQRWYMNVPRTCDVLQAWKS
ncbi:hypothetical protein GDO81_018440 [Engystomops pustulosus]|uniref:Uncharacterized protein n=1 Tax=Engystomops pustulosus TaxID=76066 RepID=A0AAV6ZPE6_ENGPU|nr:hypothetical protein GDO81_018440 [Engystomops pustulosus]